MALRAGRSAASHAAAGSAARLGDNATEAAAAAAGVDLDGDDADGTKPASPQSYCTCGFRHHEFLAGDFDLHAERPDAVCQASSVPGPDSCVKGPCGAHPNRKQREGTGSPFSASADAVYRLPRVAINMGGGGRYKKPVPVVFRGCFETSTVGPGRKRAQNSTGWHLTQETMEGHFLPSVS
jgi:hypothetical protein